MNEHTEVKEQCTICIIKADNSVVVKQTKEEKKNEN